MQEIKMFDQEKTCSAVKFVEKNVTLHFRRPEEVLKWINNHKFKEIFRILTAFKSLFTLSAKGKNIYI